MFSLCIALAAATARAELHAAAADSAAPTLDDGSSELSPRHGLQQYGALLGYGWSQQRQIGVIPVFAHAGWAFWDVIDRPLRRWHLDLNYVLEGWIAGLNAPYTSAVEFGINPLSARIAYDAGQQFVPYLQAGVGVMYTSIQGARLGGPFEFDEYGAVGLELYCTRNYALTIEYRYRHMSNAGINDDNRGLDTSFVLFGFTKHPQR